VEFSINAMHFLKTRPGEPSRDVKDCVALVREAGFRLVDLSAGAELDYEELARYISECGVRVNQTHAPYNRYKREDYSVFGETMMQSIRNTKTLGSPIMVVHGDEFDFAKEQFSKEAAVEFNYRFFAPVVEYAELNGMQVAFECVFQEAGMDRPRFCSYVEDLCDLCDRFGSKAVGVCWDVGHAKVQYGEKHIDALKQAGKRVISTHIHDNYYEKDLHLFPFLGDTAWEDFMAALKGIGYQGDFTFEFVYDRIPAKFLPEYLSLVRRTGEYLISL